MTGARLGEVEHGLVACRDGRIVYAGPMQEAPPLEASSIINCEGCWITPGLIDPHTHLVYAGDRAAVIPAAAEAGLADAVDAFCEAIGFTPAQTERVFQAAKAHGLPVKLHAEQLSNQSGAALAARFSALSADHLEHLDEDGVQAMAKAGVTAVLLPGAYYFMRETELPPLARLREAGVPIALATDCNPGTLPLTSPLLVLNMAATLFRMTVPECLLGLTREAARALGRLHEIGTLEAGKRCDLAIWQVDRLAELVYRIGSNPLRSRVWGGLA